MQNNPSITVGRNELEKAQDALVKLFLPQFDTRGVAAFRGIQEAYIFFTGDQDIRGFGWFYPAAVSAGLRTCADFDSSSFSYALQNALNLYLSAIFKAQPFHEEIFITNKLKVTNFRQIDSIQIRYFGDIPEVDPESGDYQSVEGMADSTAYYDLSHKGAVLWITRRVIVNDTISVVKGLVERMARAARRTHAKYVWAFYINNATCPDGTSWFTSGHGNLASDALDFSPIIAAIKALANMTEPGPSTEKIGMDLPLDWYLIVPTALCDAAISKNVPEYLDNAFTPNPCYRLFGERSERIVVSPFLEDETDWGIVRTGIPIVEMSYYQGKEEPEFVLSDIPTSESVFTADKQGWKLRYEFGGTLVDYRGGHKSIVAG